MLTHLLNLLTWIGSHPWQVVGGLAIVWAVATVIGLIIFALVLAHEARKADSERRTLMAEMEPQPIRWPPPSGKKGFARRNV